MRRPAPAARRGRCPLATRRWTLEPFIASVIFMARKSFGNLFFPVNIFCKFFFLYSLVFSKMSSENARPCPVVRSMRRVGPFIWGGGCPWGVKVGAGQKLGEHGEVAELRASRPLLPGTILEGLCIPTQRVSCLLCPPWPSPPRRPGTPDHAPTSWGIWNFRTTPSS